MQIWFIKYIISLITPFDDNNNNGIPIDKNKHAGTDIIPSALIIFEFFSCLYISNKITNNKTDIINVLLWVRQNVIIVIIEIPTKWVFVISSFFQHTKHNIKYNMAHANLLGCVNPKP